MPPSHDAEVPPARAPANPTDTNPPPAEEQTSGKPPTKKSKSNNGTHTPRGTPIVEEEDHRPQPPPQPETIDERDSRPNAPLPNRKHMPPHIWSDPFGPSIRQEHNPHLWMTEADPSPVAKPRNLEVRAPVTQCT
jgi:hypothetical protein